ncbi:unnamed protein product [Gongylonema pulchrum]|uniref:RNA helicase n=1 Tax=Gongylonema pulchrum TaxID=637853 RepID=A0A183ERM3_9BILA|nr:unnamed protein product [Gongylonema pulchrum]
MHPKKTGTTSDGAAMKTTLQDDKELLRKTLPVLAMPNQNADDLMAELEHLQPKWKQEKAKADKKENGRSRHHSTGTDSRSEKRRDVDKNKRTKHSRDRSTDRRNDAKDRRRRRSSDRVEKRPTK